VVEVFHFQLWNIGDGRYWIPPFKATREFIRKSHGKAIAATREEVLPSILDEEGRCLLQVHLDNSRPKQGNR
jgi:hypothetical protein